MSVYDKDMGKLCLILILTIVGSISLLGYSYSYNFESLNKQDISLTTIYNSGQNTCKITNNILKELECKFTVIGYNNTGDSLNYKIVISNDNDNTINGSFVKMKMINQKQNLSLGPISLSEIEKTSLVLEEIEVPANSSNIFDEYVIKMWLDDEKLISYYLENEDSRFKINIDIIY